jgi:chorismate synthase
MTRRAPGQGAYATPRKEADTPAVLSGIKDGVATGAPLTCVIRNTNTRSEDYDALLRPGHADWTALLKYGGNADMRGGGHFSGRLTAGLVFAGAIAKQLLAEKNIKILGRIRAIGGKSDDIDLVSAPLGTGMFEKLEKISNKSFAAADDCEEMFLDTIEAAKAAGDSVGGVAEVACFGVPAGTGEPFFGSVESRVASMLFSVPAVKGVAFGRGFEIAKQKGSEANDPLVLREGNIVSLTNNNGGILGGIANGMPIIVSAAIKPTASIGAPQRTVDPRSMTEEIINVHGRHDPCIVPRALPVIEAGIAIALLDLMREGGFA